MYRRGEVMPWWLLHKYMKSGLNLPAVMLTMPTVQQPDLLRCTAEFRPHHWCRNQRDAAQQQR
ncbi:hypothetical protein BOX15_Mlig026392g1 [Macrostomum lignano]|uniref:Uncharacterized protein n=1 Tax=Macrostomum lignano TaxID=282301 RepID=A0A267FYI4_9PLAT|nr:hypothetical protein BOX15_Mlig026392g1 [Macrostomum lignano]